MPRALRVDHSPANLIVLCEACHAGVHLNLQVSLARRTLQRWAVRIARLVDHNGDLPSGDIDLTPALHALGKEALRPGQLQAILAILRGRDVLVVRPTGSGKSICFQVPTLLRPGYALVIEPLKALMKNQVAGLHDQAIPATFINGDLSPHERQARYELLDNGAWKFLYLAPERFDATVVRSPHEAARLRQLRPTFLVVDEVHSIVQYGGGFRPAYAELGAIRSDLGRPPVLAFTATAAVDTQRAIVESLDMTDAEVIVEDPNRPNISLLRLSVPEQSMRFLIVKRLLDEADGGRALIFVPTVKVGLEVQKGLRYIGADLEFFHAKAQTANWRDMTQRRFEGHLDPPVKTLIVTSAFGMGLDIPNIRLVVNWQHPFSVEEYVQAFGRAGRDGGPAKAVLFVGSNDRGLLEYMIKQEGYADQPRQLQELHQISDIVNDRRRCLRSALLEALDTPSAPKRPLAVRILEWAFARRGTRPTKVACCEVCDQRLGTSLIAPLFSARSSPRQALRRRPS